MTRKQAFLVLLMALLILATRQHLQWPSRFWESPSFQALGKDDVVMMISELNRGGEEASLTPAVIKEEPTAAPKPAMETKKEEPKKPSKKKVAKAKPSAPPVQAPKLKSIALSLYPREGVERVNRCWAVASHRISRNGVIRMQFSHDKNGYPRDVKVVEDTLGVPLVTQCVVEMITNLRFDGANPNDAEVRLYETKILFKPHEEPK